MFLTEVERFSSISFASLRASSTGWTLVRKARPKTPSKSRSSLCSIARSTWLNLPRRVVGGTVHSHWFAGHSVSDDAKRRKRSDADGARGEQAHRVRRGSTHERQRPVVDSGDDGRREHPERGDKRAARARRLPHRRDRKQRDGGERGEERPKREQEGRARLPPTHGE